MNKLAGIITSVATDGAIAFVSINVDSHIFSSLLIGDMHDVGEQVYVVFKETEVLCGSVDALKISAKNKFISPVRSIEKGRLLSKIVFDFYGTEITSVISTASCEELGLSVGKEALWFVKSSEVMVQKW